LHHLVRGEHGGWIMAIFPIFFAIFFWFFNIVSSARAAGL
jgi:hypothetical protein